MTHAVARRGRHHTVARVQHGGIHVDIDGCHMDAKHAGLIDAQGSLPRARAAAQRKITIDVGGGAEQLLRERRECKAGRHRARGSVFYPRKKS